MPSLDPSDVPTTMTRSSREVRPIKWMNLLAIDSSLAPVPTMYKHAMQDPLWHAAMMDEYQALIDNNTWSLVPCPLRANVVTGKWIFWAKVPL
jgi:hypothetical protein